LAAPAIPQGEPRAFAQLVELVRQQPPPRGQHAVLPGRGEIFVRAPRGPRDAPTVVLLHGWIGSGGLNWFQAFETLRARYRVIAPDLRGHARGIRSWRRFRLRDCADDIAALLRKRRVQDAIVVGYSMGGPVAQLMWRRHPDLVSGLVLAATSGRPLRTQSIGLLMAGVMEGAALAGRVISLRGLFRRAVALADPETHDAQADNLPLWARAEVARHDVRHLLEAGAELGRYDATSWLREIDVPTSVLVTEGDRAIPPAHQIALAKAIRGARVHKISGGHLSFADPRFGPALRTAVDSVAKRLAARASD
jgi:pimeloyl-ACP methyl ester carboxylesterase